MTILAQEIVQNLLAEIKTIRLLINEKIARTTEDEIDKFENNVSLDELESCLKSASPEELPNRFIQCLSSRWERISQTSMCYTQKPLNEVNLMCLSIAKLLSPLPADSSEIDTLPPSTGPYFLLMPTLKTSEDIYGENIHRLGLNEFLISDDQKIFIPIAKCLAHAIVSDEGEFQHVVSEDRQTFNLLSSSEESRLSHHSVLVTDYVKSIQAYNILRFHRQEITGQLNRLIIDLRAGGEKKGRDKIGKEYGKEDDSGAKANIGIINFFQFWDNLPKATRKNFLTTYPEFKDIFERLKRPNDRNFKETRFCVELIANAIENSIHKFNISGDALTQALTIVNQNKEMLEQQIKMEDYVRLDVKAKPPRVLPMIAQLSKDEQEMIFRHAHGKDAASYALKHDSEALITFPKEILVQLATQTKFMNEMNALMLAAKYGKEMAVNLLLPLTSDLDHRDANDYTALMLAVRNGHSRIVNALLEKGANLTLKIRVGEAFGKNVLDLALQYHPELIEVLLFKALNLDIEQQKEFLKNISNETYSNVLAYTMVEHPFIFKKLYEHLLKMDDRIEPIHRFLSGLKFFEHYDAMHLKCNEIISKVANGKNEYTQASKAAKNLMTQLANEAASLLQMRDILDKLRQSEFRQKCKTFIHEALKVLGDHRGWKKINLTLLMFLSFPISVPLYAAGMFSMETDSAKKLMDFEGDLEDQVSDTSSVPSL